MPLTASQCVIQADLVIGNLPATSKRQAFRHIAERTALLIGGDPDALLNALLERERIGTTGIGGGVAIPHVKMAGVESSFGVMVRLEAPVDYDAIDGEPVDIIFMLLAPAEAKTTQHLKVLAQMSRFLKDEEVRRQIRDTRDESIIAGVITRWLRDQQQAVAC